MAALVMGHFRKQQSDFVKITSYISLAFLCTGRSPELFCHLNLFLFLFVSVSLFFLSVFVFFLLVPCVRFNNKYINSMCGISCVQL